MNNPDFQPLLRNQSSDNNEPSFWKSGVRQHPPLCLPFLLTMLSILSPAGFALVAPAQGHLCIPQDRGTNHLVIFVSLYFIWRKNW